MESKFDIIFLRFDPAHRLSGSAIHERVLRMHFATILQGGHTENATTGTATRLRKIELIGWARNLLLRTYQVPINGGDFFAPFFGNGDRAKGDITHIGGNDAVVAKDVESTDWLPIRFANMMVKLHE